jgi:hypothetical protein
VWCAVSSGGITEPYFFDDEEGQSVTVNAEWYMALLKTILQNMFNFCQLNSLWF